MPTVITRPNYLEVNSVPLSTPAWWITNLEAELASSPDLRGSDTIVPHATGGLGNRRRITVTRKQLQMVITGAYDKDGGTNSNQMVGLITNIEYLTANLGIANATGAGTVTATWHRVSPLSNKTAAVHVLGLTTSPLTERPHVRAVLELSIPAGVFA